MSTPTCQPMGVVGANGADHRIIRCMNLPMKLFPALLNPLGAMAVCSVPRHSLLCPWLVVPPLGWGSHLNPVLLQSSKDPLFFGHVSPKAGGLMGEPRAGYRADPMPKACSTLAPETPGHFTLYLILEVEPAHPPEAPTLLHVRLEGL